jgi:hypothetical protein
MFIVMQKKIGSIEEDVILIGGLGVAAVFGIKYILASFGASDDEKNKVQDQANTTPAQNPFSPSFQPFLNYWSINQTPGISVQDGMQQFYALYQQGTASGEAFQIAQWADTLSSALSVWNWKTDVNAVFSVFNQMISQTQCAALAAYVSYNFNKDLLQWLHYGGSAIPWFPNGLSISQVAIIVSEVNSLPVN